ncbi:uncharacterized protein [Elaeis guineensis]|uniref:uncharacterized protein isoform X3 n=1 Tax=Elaeis guineensis var. tenera TaxID=51953 RepID=UPI003C6D7866
MPVAATPPTPRSSWEASPGRPSATPCAATSSSLARSSRPSSSPIRTPAVPRATASYALLKKKKKKKKKNKPQPCTLLLPPPLIVYNLLFQVTFKDPDSAMRACQDPSPVIDGRRANCNLASLGASHRTRPPTPRHGMAGRLRPPLAGPSIAASTYHGSAATTSYFHQPAQYSYPYSVYGYSGGYSQENMYPMSYYGLYGGSGGGGQHHQFSPYYAAAGPGVFQNFYPYYAQFSQDIQAQSGYGLHYPQMLQYPYVPQQYRAGILSMPPSIVPTTVLV